MLRHKRLVASGVAAAVLAVPFGASLFPPAPEDRVTRQNYERIKDGMSRAEVEAILGPPDDYRTGPTGMFFFTSGPMWNDMPEAAKAKMREEARLAALLQWERWRGDAGEVAIGFGPQGVADRHLQTAMRIEQTYLENLRWQVMRRWHRWFPSPSGDLYQPYDD